MIWWRRLDPRRVTQIESESMGYKLRRQRPCITDLDHNASPLCRSDPAMLVRGTCVSYIRIGYYGVDLDTTEPFSLNTRPSPA